MDEKTFYKEHTVMGDLLLRIKLLHLPLWVIIFDCLLATQMWALILLFCINAFTDTARGSYLRNLTSPLFWVGRFITPRFLSERAKPLYLALLVLLIRFYLLPFIFGYRVSEVTALPFEALVTSAVTEITYSIELLFSAEG
jgi:hypothetical protein|tara:strand:+ start:209 stop:631 length:423 start_codon:yes stop_codon:yes gene_type:complete